MPIERTIFCPHCGTAVALEDGPSQHIHAGSCRKCRVRVAYIQGGSDPLEAVVATTPVD